MSGRHQTQSPRTKTVSAGRLTAALIAAQPELQSPVRNRSVGVRTGRENYDFSYATLDSNIEHCLRPVLPKHGLWFVQFIEGAGTEQWMVTQIIHTSGETKDCPLLMPPCPEHPQGAGSLISYFKRYALCAAFGPTAEDDDDANIASRQDMADMARQPRISAEQVAELETLAAERGTNLVRFCRYLKVADLTELPESQFERAKSVLRIRRAA